MHSILEIEREATRLRRCIRIAERPDLKVLCALRFFRLFTEGSAAGLESYLREFLPVVAEACRKTTARDFLPEEIESLLEFVELVTENQSGSVSSEDMRAVTELAVSQKKGAAPAATGSAGKVQVNSLFVEYYPDLDLPPRGRLLKLSVTASSISTKVENDEIVVRNPVSEPDDRFLKQARDSVAGARRILATKFGLSEKKRYRFDFEVGSDGARLTGDSLGLAFAVGAIAAVDKTEVFRHRPTISSKAAFSGALTSTGQVLPVDEEALKLKINRAFNSEIELLAIPREHITTAWSHLQSLEKKSLSKKLELVGAGRLEDIVADPRLMPTTRSSAMGFAAQRVWKARRTAAVQIPVLVILLAILAYLVLPERHMPWFDGNPLYADVGPDMRSLEARNKDGKLIWIRHFQYSVVDTHAALVYDLDGDSLNEVLFAPKFESECPQRGWFYCYDSDGSTLFSRYCAIPGEYPNDTVGVIYDPGRPQIAIIQGKPIIVSCVQDNHPARTHLKFWDADGDSLGWYINSGGCTLALATDLDGDSTEELIFTGFNNRASPRSAAMFVLDMDSLFGVSPPYVCNYPELLGAKQGKQLGYILFPPSDLSQVSGEQKQGYNSPADVPVEIKNKGLIDFNTCESSSLREASVLYQIDFDLHVVSAKPNDFFWTHREELVAAGDLDSLTWNEYKNKLVSSIRHWDGSDFASESVSSARDNRQW